MAHLILVRHSTTQQDPALSSHEWILTGEGRERCIRLAQQLQRYTIAQVFSSDEPKAYITAQLVADQLQPPLPVTQNPAFGETLRETAPYFERREDFHAAIRAAMFSPNRLSFGEETFTAARLRFTHALRHIIEAHPGQTLAVVTHGTVMALALGYFSGTDPYPLWCRLEMPAYAVLTPNLDVLDIRTSID